MKTQSLLNTQTSYPVQLRDISHFYNETIVDYKFWSADLNMHFGYFIPFKTNPFKRDQMLNAMNDQVYNRLIKPTDKGTFVDLGCGIGGTMRHFSKRNPNITMLGVTLSDKQVREGNKHLKNVSGVILNEDYRSTSIPSGSITGTYAIESLCHCGHSPEALREAYRILKKDGKLVIADAFLKKSPYKLKGLSSYSYKKLCSSWSLDGLGVVEEVSQNLKKIGFNSIQIENISFRVAPSLFHVPFSILTYTFMQLIKGKRIKKTSKDNLMASLFSLISGFHLNDFGYYIITAKK